MTNKQTTIRDLLTSPYKPNIDCTLSQAGNTPYTTWPDIEDVQIWKVFTLDNINQEFSDVLDIPVTGVPLQLNVLPLPVHNQVNSLKDLYPLFQRNDIVLSEPLKQARTHLKLHLDKEYKSSYASVLGDPNAKFPTISGQVSCHHAIWLEHQPTLNVLAGLGKTSKHWYGSAVQAELKSKGNISNTLKTPLRQLANACNKANIRHGYIQTDKELIVVEFTLQGDNKFGAKFMPIMWSTKSGLTTDLALFCLCLISMKEAQNA
ncbi:hypothetical protein LTS17_002501 [Exophiala oligosperma]